MSTDPKRNVPSTPELSKEAQQQLDHLLEYGLGELSLRQILATAWKALNEAERRQFLNRADDDKANGFYERSLKLGSIPLDLEVPRTRSDVVPHEHRRELRALKVFGAWTNLVDLKAGNTLDTLVTENGRGVVRHYLQDVGSTFGSGARRPHDWDEGYEYLFERPATPTRPRRSSSPRF
jgi:hypothetical protein